MFSITDLLFNDVDAMEVYVVQISTTRQQTWMLDGVHARMEFSSHKMQFINIKNQWQQKTYWSSTNPFYLFAYWFIYNATNASLS